jgi:hypothetical protein
MPVHSENWNYFNSNLENRRFHALLRSRSDVVMVAVGFIPRCSITQGISSRGDD